MDHDSSAVRRFVEHVLTIQRVSPSALAKASNINHVTLTRFLNKPGNTSNLSSTTLRKIEVSSGLRLISLAGEDAKRGALAKNSDGSLLLLKYDGSFEPFKGYLAFDLDGETQPVIGSSYRVLIRSIAPIAGTVGEGGLVSPGETPRDFGWPMVQFPFDAHEPPRAWFVQTDALFPRYSYGDLLLCWGEPHQLGVYETVEGIAWNDDGAGRFGFVSFKAGKYEFDILGQKLRMPISGNGVDIIRAVIRDGSYIGVKKPSE